MRLIFDLDNPPVSKRFGELAQIINSMNCPICSKDAELEFQPCTWMISEQGCEFRYLSCKDCQLIFCHPLPTAEELNLYYSTQFNYGWYAKRRLLKKTQGFHRWLRVKKRLERRIGYKGRLLDIGCGHGWFIEAARKAGWQVTGVDLSGSALEHARDVLKLDVSEGSIETVNLPEHYYDVITMWHSLEHVPDPINVLERTKHLLKPGGFVLIAVPNVNCLGQKRQGINWVWLQQPFVHIWHFSANSLKLFLERAGFDVVSLETRDTWDAQYLYDGIWGPKLEGRYYSLVVNYGAAALRRMKFRRVEEIKEETHFYLSETSRILMYIPSLAISSLIRQMDQEHGSELLVIARINNN